MGIYIYIYHMTHIYILFIYVVNMTKELCFADTVIGHTKLKHLMSK